MRSRLPWSWSLALAAALLSAGGALPAAASADDKTISRLETKLFQHDYPREAVEARLDRLEKMVFGEAKGGAVQERIHNLLSAVPVSGSDQPARQPAGGAGGSGDAMARAGGAGADEDAGADGSKYPAVTAIESRLYGRDFAAEPIGKRLDRLETKVFGHPSGVDDLSERVDRLKQRTGIDIAKQAPPGSDWSDDDDDVAMSQPNAGAGGEGRSVGGRDLRKDFGVPQAAAGATDRWAGTGTYGMGNAPPPVGGVGGTDADDDEAPPYTVSQSPPRSQPLGLNQQVSALEQEIFGRTYPRESLPARLSRLEGTVFPQQKPSADKPLPDRVNRLISVVPLSGGGQPARAIAQHPPRAGKGDPDFGDLDDLGAMPQPGQPRATSGLGKIINSISGFLTGGYPAAPGTMTTDPQTGLWVDSRTGNLIDPITGAVVGQRMVSPGLGSGMMGGFGTFNNGFSPYGAMPYGTGYGTGMRFGFGGIGRYGFGMWP